MRPLSTYPCLLHPRVSQRMAASTLAQSWGLTGNLAEPGCGCPASLWSLT